MTNVETRPLNESPLKKVIEMQEQRAAAAVPGKSIYKVALDRMQEGGVQTLELQMEHVLHVGLQGKQITMWYIHNDNAPLKKYRFTAIGTGWNCAEIIDKWNYATTIILPPYVWHIYWKTE